MIDNPDPKKYRIKKLRKGAFILVDKQIVRWRKTGKPMVYAPEYAKTKLGPPFRSKKPKIRNFFE